jgi:hypothetical protein
MPTFPAQSAKQNSAAYHRSRRLTIASLIVFITVCIGGLRAQTLAPLSIVGPDQVRLGGSASYSALVNGTSPSVVWSVNGFAGGKVSYGTISSSGMYSPGNAIYAGHSVTIGAVTVSTPVSSGSWRVKILNPLPTLTGGSVTLAAPGDSFFLDVHGSGFVTASQLSLAGGDIATILISSKELQSIISLPAGTTTVSVGVLNPNAAQKSPVGRTLAVMGLGGTDMGPSSLANVDIGTTPGIAIPSTFMGLSHEWGTAQTLMGDSSTGVDNIYRQLLKNLMAFGSGPIELRIGGNSTDETGEPASTTVQPFAELAKALPVRFYLGVNLGSDNVNLAADQAKAYVSQMPEGSLDAIEIGNEPDIYVYNGIRTPPYTYQDYLAEFNTWQTHIMPLLPSSTKLMGPSCGNTYWLSDIQSYDSAEAGALGKFSQHHYVANGKANNPDDILLTPSAASSGPNAVATSVKTTHQFGISFRMGEINSLYNGGETGISNGFESALWAIDTMFQYVNVGVDGVNWHTGYWGGGYDAFGLDIRSSGANSSYALTLVNPLYYGLLFFQAATGNGAHLLPVTLSTQANLKAWATVDASGTTRLVLINKDETSTGAVDITLSGYSHAQIYRLAAPSYLSTSGVTFAGQTFDGSTNGVIQGTQTAESVDVLDGTFEVPMPITSAALVIFTN